VAEIGRRFIYGLYDPRNPKLVMVVGETSRTIEQRLSVYLCQAQRKRRLDRRKMPSEFWILKLLDAGIRPGIRLLATTSDKHWQTSERRFITIWRRKNPTLLNKHRGGNGRDVGPVKLICDKHNRRRVLLPSGQWLCHICARNRGRKTYYKNPKASHDRHRKWIREHPGYTAKIARRWYKKHRRKSIEYASNWAKMNRRQFNATMRRIYHKNLEKSRAYGRDKYHAHKLGLTVVQFRAQLAAA